MHFNLTIDKVARAAQKANQPSSVSVLLGWSIPVIVVSAYNCEAICNSCLSLDGMVTSSRMQLGSMKFVFRRL